MKKILFTIFLLVGFQVYAINLAHLLFSLKRSYAFFGSRSFCHAGSKLSERIRACIREGGISEGSRLEDLLPQAFDHFSQKELHEMHASLLPLLKKGDSEFIDFYAKLWQEHMKKDHKIVISLMPEQLKESAENTCQMALGLLFAIHPEE